MASILSSVNQSDMIIDKRLSASYGAKGGGVGVGGSGGGVGGVGGVGVVGSGNSGSVSGDGDSSGNYTTGTPAAIWFSYNSSSTHTIENTNASRHFADHPAAAETSGAVGIEAIIIVVVVSLIPVSVIACMVFVISFNCLKRRSSLWSTNASPNATEKNLVARTQTRIACVDVDGDGGGGGGGGGGRSGVDGNRRKSTIRSIMDNENLTEVNPFNGDHGDNDHRIATIDTPLSLIYPADGFSAAYLDTSKSSLTTPISNNSVITMTMRNNHLIVETEERIPCTFLDGQHWYGGACAGADAYNATASNVYVQCQVEEYELNDDSLLDETDSYCENRYCQHEHGTTCASASENGCVFCRNDDDDDDDDDEVDANDDHDDVNYEDNDRYRDKKATIRNTIATSASASASSIGCGVGVGVGDTSATVISSTTEYRGTRVQSDEEDQPVLLFHKNIAATATAAAAVAVTVAEERPNVRNNDDDDDEDDVRFRTVNTGYSQSDAGESSKRAQNHYVYGNQCEYVASAESQSQSQSARNKRFASAPNWPNRHHRWSVDAGAGASASSIPTLSVCASAQAQAQAQYRAQSRSPSPPPAHSVRLRSADSDNSSLSTQAPSSQLAAGSP